ncbi:uncharacterized protein LOC127705556 isoform X2 [Mytilus californianus]|uniref:uncharacterized protein LOC127705556 isoform X2 n=1 Tax=Mytilus californianus TaxID=6549 RepID=UPI002246ACD6|nr:uncharacterized protein LOC127705556 isoform X2 [Mytilus californianus]
MVCVTEGGEYSKKLYTHKMFCPDGEAHEQLLTYPIRYTCKPGPGINVKCQTIFYNFKGYFECPGNGYMSGFEFTIGYGENIRCCQDPDITYSKEDCTVQFNNNLISGKPYKICKGKIMVGSKTLDGGKTWYNTECSFRSKRKYY